MSPELRDLLFLVRQHPAFPELLAELDKQKPPNADFKPSRADTAQQTEQWIFRSGRRAQHDLARSFRIGERPQGQETSQQENP